MPKVLVSQSPLTEAMVQEWLGEILAAAPDPAKVHFTTYLRSCVPALMEKLGGSGTDTKIHPDGSISGPVPLTFRQDLGG